MRIGGEVVPAISWRRGERRLNESGEDVLVEDDVVVSVALLVEEGRW